MINPPKATKAPNIERKSVLDWSVGTVTDYDSRRIVEDALSSSVNMELEQNGVLRPRPSLTLYGPQPKGPILGELFEAKHVSGPASTFYLISMQVIDGKGKICYCKGEDNEWKVIEDKDYDASAPVHFLQISNKIVVLNGVDAMSVIDLTTWTIKTFQKLDKPNKPTVKATGLDGSGFYAYYAVSAISTVGETEASEPVSVKIGTDRVAWDPEKQSIEVTWEKVEGATGYNLYMGQSLDGEGEPVMYLLQANIHPDTTSFKDDGTYAYSLVMAPNFNSTEGPKATRGAVINGRIWLVGDTENPYRVWYGGDFGYEIEFAPGGNGGGFVNINSGTKEVPVAVLPFRKGQGDSSVVVLTQSSNGSGRRVQINYSQMSYGGDSTIAWTPLEDSGRDGTDSPDAVVVYNNSLYYPSRDGFKTTGTMPSLQNVLSTKTISATIRDQISLLKSSAMNKAIGVSYEGRIYWALPVGSTDNNRVWIYYPDQKGAWMTSWYLDVKWMTLYNDNSGDTHFLFYCADGKIYELNRSVATADGGIGFETNMASGMVQFSKDGREWSRLIQIVFTFLRPKGEFDITVEAMTEDGIMKYRQNVVASTGSQARGWSEVTNRRPRMVPYSTPGVPTETLEESMDVIIEIDEDVQWFTYSVHSVKTGVDYKISSVVAEHVSIGIKDLS